MTNPTMEEHKSKLNISQGKVDKPGKEPLPEEPSKWLSHMSRHSKVAPTYIMFYTQKGQVHIYPMPGFTVGDSEVQPEDTYEAVTVAVENPNWVFTGSIWRKIC